MKKFEYTKLENLLSEVRNFLPSMEQYIDEAKVLGKVLWCNDKIGIPIRRISENILKVRNYTTELPLDFQKMIYVAALDTTSFGLAQYSDPLNNFTDTTDTSKVEMICWTESCTLKSRTIYKKDLLNKIVGTYNTWHELNLSPSSYIHTASTCINRKVRGEYEIDIDEEEITTPFREGELYVMYYGNMKDEEGNILVPLDPLIFSWYKWCIIEEVLLSMAFNSEGDVVNKLKLAQSERLKAWLDASGYTIDQTYKEAIDYQNKREMEFFNKHFRGIV